MTHSSSGQRHSHPAKVSGVRSRKVNVAQATAPKPFGTRAVAIRAKNSVAEVPHFQVKSVEPAVAEIETTESLLRELDDLDRDSLLTFLWELIASLEKRKINVPYRNERAWQRLFCDLKREYAKDGPPFLKDLYFDADGPFLKSAELSEAIEGLQLGATVAAMNPTFDSLRYPPASLGGKKWLSELKTRPRRYQSFVTRAVQLAGTLFTATSEEA